MTPDAAPREENSRGRRPGNRLLAVLAVLLLLGGGTALAVGLLGQDADPPAPAASAATPTTSSAPPSSASPEAEPTTSAPEPTAEQDVAEPVAISIPAIDVQSELLHLGLNPDGTVEVPQPGPDYDKAAWLDVSPRPGETGPAVIEGHVDSAENGPSIFYDLGRLVPGDRVEVRRADDTVAAFVVKRVEVFPKDDFPTLAVYGNTDGPELRLITCGGPFDSEARSYEDNVVVFASPA